MSFGGDTDLPRASLIIRRTAKEDALKQYENHNEILINLLEVI